MLTSLAGAGSWKGIIFSIFFWDRLFECKYGIIVIQGPLFDRLINVSKLPLFNSYCLLRSSNVHRFNTWFLKQCPSLRINKSPFDKSSTSKTLTISDETPTLNLSLVLILLKSPLTGRKVTMPVAVAVPIPWVRISFVDVIPISCGPIRSVAVDDNPPTFTITEFCKFKDVDAMPTKSFPNVLKNLTPDMVSLDILVN